jgi:hypothetical protein
MLSRAISDGSRYYTLSYTPTNPKADGSFRRIQVKLRNGSYTVAYRRGYYATDTIFGTAPATTTNTAKTGTTEIPQRVESPASTSTHTPASPASSTWLS